MFSVIALLHSKPTINLSSQALLKINPIIPTLRNHVCFGCARIQSKAVLVPFSHLLSVKSGSITSSPPLLEDESSDEEPSPPGGEGPAAPAPAPGWLYINRPICITSWLRAATESLISWVDPLSILSLSSCCEINFYDCNYEIYPRPN